MVISGPEKLARRSHDWCEHINPLRTGAIAYTLALNLETRLITTKELGWDVGAAVNQPRSQDGEGSLAHSPLVP